MNALVKKEIRLLLPSWGAAMLLAMVQAITRPYDFYVASLLFFGLTIMALTVIGRESSLNTFSSLLAQPAERLRIWETKLWVLVGAFLTVFVVWLIAFGIAFMTSNVDAADAESSGNLFITVCLIATATFTGGLWTTMLLRQIAGAFWLTLLVPAVLAGFTAAFLAESNSDNAIIAALCVIIAIYSVSGFLFARWLFFRAQDVGWSGGNIALPDWKLFGSRSENAVSTRNRKPIFALVKKEFQLQQVSLLGAAGLLVLHVGVLVLRTHHKFAKDSAGEVLTSIVWLLWLVFPVVIGAMAVAEERRLGMMEGQLCLPVSRRVQFVIKALLTVLLGTFLGGVLPILLDITGSGSAFAGAPTYVPLAIVSLALWLALVSFFASSLARNFLQAIGFAIGTFIGFALIVPAFAKGWTFIFDGLPMGSILSLVIAVPTLVVTLPLLTYLNYKHFLNDWRLWRRNLLGVAGAMIFVVASSTTIYNRAWEVFEPAEPAHGSAKLSQANPATLQVARGWNLLVRLPDGRVWFDYLGESSYDYFNGSFQLNYVWRTLTHPLRESSGRFLAGSNWVAATTAKMFFSWDVNGKHFGISDYMETVGIQPDGTLWIADKPETGKRTPGKLQQFGGGNDWRQLAQGSTSVVLLKGDGTLWRWGSLTNGLHQWPGLPTFTPYQIGTNADWQELFTMNQIFAKRPDGRVWLLGVDWKTGKDELIRATNYDEIVLQTASSVGDQATAFVRADGTLWVLNRYWDEKSRLMLGTGVLQVGKESGWRSVAVNYHTMVALKTDGSLWQWIFDEGSIVRAVNVSPTRLGIHNDWVAITGMRSDVIALAADGSLWLWPDRKYYAYDGALLKLSKQPQSLGNVLGQSN